MALRPPAPPLPPLALAPAESMVVACGSGWGTREHGLSRVSTSRRWHDKTRAVLACVAHWKGYTDAAGGEWHNHTLRANNLLDDRIITDFSSWQPRDCCANTCTRTAERRRPRAADNMARQDPGDRWKGKIAVVTGASAGIGCDVVVALCTTLGMRVAGCARRADKLNALRKELAGTAGAGEFFPVQCDLTSDASIAAMFAAVDAHWPGEGIAVLVNNAGIAHQDSVLEGVCVCVFCVAV